MFGRHYSPGKRCLVYCGDDRCNCDRGPMGSGPMGKWQNPMEDEEMVRFAEGEEIDPNNFWINLYKGGVEGPYASEEKADKYALANKLENRMGKAINVKTGPNPLDFASLRLANTTREQRWHTKDDGRQVPSWTPERLIVAMMGELGEACNCLKKTWRWEEGLPGNKEEIGVVLHKLRREFGDVQVYLDLVCKRLEIDLGQATRDVFNDKSEELGFPERV